MEKKNKIIFVEALVFTIVVFVLGILIGMRVENNNIDEINEAYLNSQVTMFDTYLASNFISSNSSCDFIKEQAIILANRIYSEAELMDEYESSAQISENIKIVHRKYDVLRTMLWNIIESSHNKCSNYNMIVYLYKYETEDLTNQALQNTWSRFLDEIKEEMGNDMILIPIAVDQELLSLDGILQNYNIEKYPAVILNDDEIFYSVPSKSEFVEMMN